MKAVYYNSHNVPPTWRNRGVEMKVDGKYIPLPSESQIMVSDEDLEFCELIALEYKLNLNEFCALVDYARGEKWKLKEEKAYQPISDALAAGEQIDRIVIQTKDDKKAIHTFILNDPYLEALIIQRYKGWQLHTYQYPNPDGSLVTVHTGDGLTKYEHTFRVILVNLFSYLDNQGKGPSQCHTIIGMICSYLEIYPINYPLPKEHECKSRGKWKATVKGRVKSWFKTFSLPLF